MFLWIMAGLLLAGCRTVSHPAARHAGADTASAVPDVDEKIVEAHAHYALGMIYDLDEQPELAREELSKAALADPSNADLVLELTRDYLQQKQPEKAIELLLHATALPDASGVLFARLAMVYSQLGKDEQAIAAAQTAIKRDAAALEGYRVLFAIQLQRGRPKEALKVLDQAARLPDSSAEFDIELVELYATLEQQVPSEKAAIDVTAMAALNRAVRQKPSNPQLRLRLADDFNALGAVSNAAPIYLQLIDEFSDLPAARADVRHRLAAMYTSAGDHQKAAEQLQAIVADDPTNVQAYYSLARLLEDENKLAEAADYYQKTILLNEDVEQAYYELANVQIYLDQPQSALDTLAKARRKFRVSFVYEYLSARAYEKQKDYTNAVSHFTTAEVVAKTSEPDRLNGDFYFGQGAAYERAGDFDDAERSFEKSLSLTPNFAEALNYLGYMLADRGVKLDKARDLIEKALKLEPKNPAYLDSMGWVLFKLNRAQEALPQLQKAIALSDAPDPTLYDHLGDIYAALKDTTKAREAWTKSLDLEASDQVRKKLDQAGGRTSQNSAH